MCLLFAVCYFVFWMWEGFWRWNLNITATPICQGQKVSVVGFPAKIIQGEKKLVLEDEDLERYYSETSLGICSIHVKIGFQVRYRCSNIRETGVYDLSNMIHCELKIPPTSSDKNGTSSTSFHFRKTRCSNWSLFLVGKRYL